MAGGGKRNNNLYYLYVAIVCLLLAAIIWVFFYRKLRETDHMIMETREKQTAFARHGALKKNAAASDRSVYQFNCSLCMFLPE